MSTSFLRLSCGWNADPNAPEPRATVDGSDVVLTFLVNSIIFTQYSRADLGVLRFRACSRYGWSDVNDEGWYRGQCRFSGVAPAWGEFYELTGDLRLDAADVDWVDVSTPTRPTRHFLFYFRDETFECDAEDYSFDVESGGAKHRQLSL